MSSYLDTRWSKLKNLDFGESKSRGGESQKFLDSENDSDEEEWIQQLARDYGKRSHSKFNKKLTKLEKYLVFGFSILSLLIISLIFVLLIKHHGISSLQGIEDFVLPNGEKLYSVQRTCLTKGCVRASNHLMKYMDDSVDPCNDFYYFSCGKWLRDVTIPSGYSKWTSFNEISEKNQYLIKKILDSLTPYKNDSVIWHKVRDFYHACRNTAKIENDGAKPLHELIKYVGSWSMTNDTDWNEEEWNFGLALNRIHRLKSMPLFYMFVAADDKNASQYVIQVGIVHFIFLK